MSLNVHNKYFGKRNLKSESIWGHQSLLRKEACAFTLKGLSLKPLNDQHLIPPYSSVYENKGNTCQSQKLDCSMNSSFQY